MASSRKMLRAYEGGVALGLGWAQLSIGGQNLQQEVDPTATSACFEIDIAGWPRPTLRLVLRSRRANHRPLLRVRAEAVGLGRM